MGWNTSFLRAKAVGRVIEIQSIFRHTHRFCIIGFDGPTWSATVLDLNNNKVIRFDVNRDYVVWV